MNVRVFLSCVGFSVFLTGAAAVRADEIPSEDVFRSTLMTRMVETSDTLAAKIASFEKLAESRQNQIAELQTSSNYSACVSVRKPRPGVREDACRTLEAQLQALATETSKLVEEDALGNTAWESEEEFLRFDQSLTGKRQEIADTLYRKQMQAVRDSGDKLLADVKLLETAPSITDESASGALNGLDRVSARLRKNSQKLRQILAEIKSAGIADIQAYKDTL